MKFLPTVSLMFIVMGFAQGQMDIRCALEPLPVGLCVNRIVGYTYSVTRTRCIVYESRGCEVRGNFFASRNECEAKCRPATSFRDNPFTFYLQRSLTEARNILGRLFNL
ncbi:uncharacterized protein [Drosophila takahashii]|uniref:uncharacterized protein n=1 Tax=Drosophila takahashii TaxID=29030 RepID=UPI0007E88A90|nr:uncharacterized protein LOC108064242 [Drosophila takahashii]